MDDPLISLDGPARWTGLSQLLKRYGFRHPYRTTMPVLVISLL